MSATDRRHSRQPFYARLKVNTGGICSRKALGHAQYWFTNKTEHNAYGMYIYSSFNFT